MIYLALPILNESHNIEALVKCFTSQLVSDFELFACVNNYEHWWDNTELRAQCSDNQESIKCLRSITAFVTHIIDRSSPNKGWPKKKGGVGHARKALMDAISHVGAPDDIIISIDADTFYPSNYLFEVKKIFDNSKLMGLSIPYYHNLLANNERLILRYEIYMRHYLLNMFRINNPFAFTAIGSAMAFPVWAYRKVGGITPVKSGEDFYFVQKLAKSGKISNWANTTAFPSSRFSSRVDFGTGPALIKGESGDWSSYPIYHHSLFDDVKSTYDTFNLLFEKNVSVPMDEYLYKQFKSKDLWNALRLNYKDLGNFVKACSNKVDALRILQFLKAENSNFALSDASILREYFFKYHANNLNTELYSIIENLDLDNSSIEDLDKLRNFMFETENQIREKQSLA